MIIDLHTHTRFGSACSYLYPWDLAQRAKELGLDGVCITEHNLCWSAEDLEALSHEYNILVLGGAEADTDLGEFIVFGIPQVQWWDSQAQELRHLVDTYQGVMIASHPFRGDRLSRSSARVEEASNRPLFQLADAVELFNGNSSRQEMDFGCQVLERLKLKGVGGSDAHALHTIGQCVTIFEKPIHDTRELVAELKAGRFHAWHRRLNRTF